MYSTEATFSNFPNAVCKARTEFAVLHGTLQNQQGRNNILLYSPYFAGRGLNPKISKVNENTW